ncbi:hypothetical protein NQ176_g1818 [Zarea fungicola]|uniref:Uncharacterized protein n=1 Tax=Zarea fungicola TaxID=93591 RepID=A0ACC1NS62_9HYPO|nr:hypothetical protein NQ176_g1818 [Lecanicillium fungicola]
MPLFSKYSTGKFREGKWYCGCDEEAKWATSSAETSKGERCLFPYDTPRDGDCGFFLTEKDEPKARLQKSQDVPTSAPRTPAARRAVDAIPTPTTGSGSRVGLFSGGSMKSYTSRINDSPSARRRRANTADDDDLASRVIDLLRDDEIAIKPITESAIRHIIGEEISSLESKLQNSEKSLKFALEKLENAPK